MDRLPEQLFPDYSPDRTRVHITGFSKNTNCESGSDYNYALVGTYRLVGIRERAYVELSPSMLPDAPNKVQIEYLANKFAFICRTCGFRGLFPEAVIHGALMHNDIYLMIEYKMPGEVSPRPISVLEVKTGFVG